MFFNGWSIRMTKKRHITITSEFGEEYVLDKKKEKLSDEEMLDILKKFMQEKEAPKNQDEGE